MTRQSWRRILVEATGYILCVFVCRYVVQFAASEAAHLIYRLKYPFARIDSTNLAHFYVDNWLVFTLLAGMDQLLTQFGEVQRPRSYGFPHSVC